MRVRRRSKNPQGAACGLVPAHGEVSGGRRARDQQLPLSGALPLTLLIEPGGKIFWRSNAEINVLELGRQIVKWLDTQ
jgi:hypothetical protein